MHTGREGYEPKPVTGNDSDDDDDDEDESALTPTYAAGDIAGAHWETARPQRGGTARALPSSFRVSFSTLGSS